MFDNRQQEKPIAFNCLVKVLIFILLFSIIATSSCNRDSGTIQNDETSKKPIPAFPSVAEDFSWEIKGGILGIIGEGGMPDYESFTQTPWYEDREKVEMIVFYDGITSVGKLAFSGMSTVTEVHFPETVTHIGESAFAECSGIEIISLPESLVFIGANAFSGCSKIKELNLHHNVNYIGESAFALCSSLEKMEIPEGITTLADYTFFQCKNLKEVTLTETVKHVGKGVFRNCTNLEFVYYTGKISDWDAIPKDDSWNENAPKLNVYYSE